MYGVTSVFNAITPFLFIQIVGLTIFKKEKVVSFNLETPKGVIASRLSVKPETFSRILSNFSSQGLVKVKGGEVEILNPKGLMDEAKSAGICGHNVGPDRDGE